ncbi:transporter substrate-binding domain-containing protein [Agrococcus sp. HG114]|uniref:transporter substrate-binding domain-containing protein n=1 Tax=Agrococcus sp. HG114 TaxID=2969757 RepID=UPI00215B153D|nr:transporter substrate-binding domain-containing protein [Agrococcus sp. HG114]MCR8669999.1 transporter substrate-binding domain-containing protein [Agrococcus sp. HG114]
MKTLVRMMAAGVAALALTGCGMQIPADPEGTLDRVEGGVLRVGVTEREPWVDLDSQGEPAGTEAELVTRFAERLDAEIEWTTGSEAALVQALEGDQLDLVIGGFQHDTPWVQHVGVTRTYTEVETAGGAKEQHVMLVPMGENAFLVELETFLHEEVGR